MRGATKRIGGASSSAFDFNPRTPCGVRPVRPPAYFDRLTISIHAPHAGCDLLNNAFPQSDFPISIHAPHAGCDVTILRKQGFIAYFNPRTPCGVRHALHIDHRFLVQISIHAPHAGCDDYPAGWKEVTEYFNPRTPCGVRRTAREPPAVMSVFQSTHPMRGATSAFPILKLFPEFQSTHPMRGATSRLSLLFRAP